jgi:hypothetical protein
MSNIEYLTEDPIIPSQQYVCLSFIEPPKDLLEAKEDFFMKNFLKQFMKDMYLDFCMKNNLDHEKVEQPSFTDTQIEEMYKAFKENHFDRLQHEFSEKNQHRTNVRGLKVRGSYTTVEEAKARAKKLQRDDNAHHIFVGQVGFWCPFNPVNLDSVDQEHIDSRLNDLIKEKKLADYKAKEHFEQRQRDLMAKQMEQENIQTSMKTETTTSEEVTTI